MLFLCWCYYLHTLRDSVSPVCETNKSLHLNTVVVFLLLLLVNQSSSLHHLALPIKPNTPNNCGPIDLLPARPAGRSWRPAGPSGGWSRGPGWASSWRTGRAAAGGPGATTLEICQEFWNQSGLTTNEPVIHIPYLNSECSSSAVLGVGKGQA